jgi:hypothetical protein
LIIEQGKKMVVDQVGLINIKKTQKLLNGVALNNSTEDININSLMK